jgi:hypothetical protein
VSVSSIRVSRTDSPTLENIDAQRRRRGNAWRIAGRPRRYPRASPYSKKR